MHVDAGPKKKGGREKKAFTNGISDILKRQLHRVAAGIIHGVIAAIVVKENRGAKHAALPLGRYTCAKKDDQRRNQDGQANH